MTDLPRPAITKPICVVIDTNIWREHYLLNSPTGKALEHAVRAKGGRIALPEVAEFEIVKHVVKAGIDSAKRVRDDLRKIETITGINHPYEELSHEYFREAVSKRLAELDDILLRQPLTGAHAMRAIERVDKGLPPNGKDNAQFKDSVIWESLFDLTDAYEVHFVSNDGDFYARKGQSALAPNLQEECDDRGITIHTYRELGDAVNLLAERAPAFDVEALYEQVDRKMRIAIPESTRPSIEGQTSVWDDINVSLDRLTDSKILAYATDVLDKLSLALHLTYAVTDLTPDLPEGVAYTSLEVRGEGLYDKESDEITRIRVTSMSTTSASPRAVYWMAGFPFGGESDDSPRGPLYYEFPWPSKSPR